MKKLNKGFTLIELLIVVAIIGILASLLMANFVGVRQRGRDAQRKSDLRQIQSAFELYRADSGDYPTSLGSSIISADGLTTYMKKVPVDSQGDEYFYGTDSTGYCLRACLENTGDPDRDENNGYDDNYSCASISSCSSGKKSFTVQNP